MYITSQAELDDNIKNFHDQKVIAIDTEFAREHNFYPILSLIQISDGTSTIAIDMLQKLDFSSLIDILSNRKITKVFHASRQDVEAIYSTFKIIPKNIHDTQLASQFIGYQDPPGLSILAKDLLDMEINKSLQYSNWLERPIDPKLIAYAKQDAELLFKIYPLLLEKLKSQRKYNIFIHECRNLYLTPDFYPSSQELLLKFSHSLKHHSDLIKALKFVKAREKIGMEKNLARSHIIRDEAIIYHIKSGKNPHCRYWNSLLKKIDNTVTEEERKTVTNLIKKVSIREKIDFAVLDKLKVLLKHISDKCSIAKSLIANKDDLNKLAQGKRATKSLKTWRHDCFGKYAKAIQNGKIEISVQGSHIILTTKRFWIFKCKLDLDNELAKTLKKWTNKNLK